MRSHGSPMRRRRRRSARRPDETGREQRGHAMGVGDARARASRIRRWSSRRTVCDGTVWPPVCRLQASSLGLGGKRRVRVRQERERAGGGSILAAARDRDSSVVEALSVLRRLETVDRAAESGCAGAGVGVGMGVGVLLLRIALRGLFSAFCFLLRVGQGMPISLLMRVSRASASYSVRLCLARALCRYQMQIKERSLGGEDCEVAKGDATVALQHMWWCQPVL